jgi:hypothetical protein
MDEVHDQPTFVVTFLLISAALLGVAASAQAETILRGTSELNLSGKGAKDTTTKVNFPATKLHTQLLRFDMRWYKLEPQRNGYDQTYLDQLAKTIHTAASDRLKVIVTVYGRSRWASDQTVWQYAPTGSNPGVYRSYYPPALNRLVDFQAFATKLATTDAATLWATSATTSPTSGSRCSRSARRATTPLACVATPPC